MNGAATTTKHGGTGATSMATRYLLLRVVALLLFGTRQQSFVVAGLHAHALSLLLLAEGVLEALRVENARSSGHVARVEIVLDQTPWHLA